MRVRRLCFAWPALGDGRRGRGYFRIRWLALFALEKNSRTGDVSWGEGGAVGVVNVIPGQARLPFDSRCKTCLWDRVFGASCLMALVRDSLDPSSVSRPQVELGVGCEI